MRGVDYSRGRPNLEQLVMDGYQFVARYLSYPVDPPGKVVTRAEVDEIHAVGLDLVLVWEYDARDAAGGWSAGQAHAASALRQAEDLGAPPDTAIYFAVDFDVQSNDLGVVAEYFAGVATVLPVRRIGVYGGKRAVSFLLGHQLVSRAWQTYAWSGGVWDVRAEIHQYLNGQTVAGAECDLNESLTDHFGQWSAGGDMTFTDEDRAHLIATDARIREVLLKGTSEYDDTPGEGPGTQPWLVKILISIDGQLDDLNEHLRRIATPEITPGHLSELVVRVADAVAARLAPRSDIAALAAELAELLQQRPDR